MSRYFLFGTLLWDALLADVAGEDVGVSRAVLPGWSVERAAAGDWPVLVPGGTAKGYLTAPLSPKAKARLDWYEVAFGYAPEAVTVDGPEGPVAALVYREAGGSGGSGEDWSLTDWVAKHGARTRIAAAEVLRGLGKVTPQEIAARRGFIQSRAQGIATALDTHRPTTLGCTTRADAVDVKRVDYVYEGFHRVEEWFIDHPRFDGGQSGTVKRAISHVSDASTVLPYDPRRDRVLLVEQIRVGALAKGDPLPWMLEPVAGLIDAGETPESAAIRETWEEAGLKVAPKDLHFVGRYYPSPGGLAQILHSFVAICDLPDGADGLHGVLTEDEDIRAHLLSLDDLLAMVPSGEAANAPLIVSAQWLALHRDRLRG
ncbi:nudix-type nucleoside diphosphatase, YffH/AdpP family [Jannaschia faecimaris]|uniref:ADP-ribose pyrophosphatase n=1 Tax=Jannaschia faecimaris TaxID=1244108 RepID=A0A1H3S4C3_9RHOB|nr:NUDIX domain-containing protein [Jannaschia faecimaris]SDZ32734.1 nudix-type nucleoside diphosphatase, YffH/AdpP family [Jannaschia faecimaris]